MAKSKKDILLELHKSQPDITPEIAAEKAECTVAYAKRILAAEQEKMNNDIVLIGQKLGIRTEELQDWYNWVVSSLSNPNSIKCFHDYEAYQKRFKGENINV